jgi:hypothetical protein
MSEPLPVLAGASRVGCRDSLHSDVIHRQGTNLLTIEPETVRELAQDLRVSESVLVVFRGDARESILWGDEA